MRPDLTAMAQQHAMDDSPDGGVPSQVVRQMWSLFEPVHAVTYFSPEARSAFAEAGLRGFWRGYFAGRAAPLGEAGPVQVTAAFFSFAAPRRWRFPAIRWPGSGTR
jgi:hypothetical protein